MSWMKDRTGSFVRGGFGSALLRSAKKNIDKVRNGEGGTLNKVLPIAEIALGVKAIYEAVFRK